MEKASAEKPFYERFFQMEKDFNLFHLRTPEGFQIWDILRYRVAYELNNSKNPQINIYNQVWFKRILRFKPSAIEIYSLLNILFPINENLFILASRNSENKIAFDQNADSPLLLFKRKKCSIIETCNPQGKYKYSKYKVVLNSFFDIAASFCRKKAKIDHTQFRKIIEAIEYSFKESSLTESLLIGEYLSFYGLYSLYDFLFRLNKNRLKRLFITQNGIQKGLLLAARKNKIRTFEFQHGLIDMTHITYSYSADISYHDSDIIAPDILFTFSKFWNTAFNNPSIKCVSVGNDYFSKKIITSSKNSLTVVSSLIHDADLRGLTRQIAETLPELQINYKLHNNHFWQYDEISDYFSKNTNVVVITNESSIYDLLSESKAILTIVSTAVFEALHNNVKAIILKRMNYLAHKNIFDNPNVFFISDLEDFLNIFDNLGRFDYVKKETFFDEFNKEAFLKSLAY